MKTKRTNIAAEPRRVSPTEGSFSLIETVIALSIVTFLIIEVAAVQGNSIVFSDYGRNITQATWLAKRVMSQVDYYWRTKPFKELATKVGPVKFEDMPEYSYSLEIKEWKFPLIQMLQQVLGGGSAGGKDKGDDDGEKKGAGDGMSGMVETIMKQVFGDEPAMMTANVEVSWSEGAQNNSTSLTLLLTNQNKLDEAVMAQKATFDKLKHPAGVAPVSATPGTGGPPGATGGATAGATGGAAGGAAGGGTGGGPGGAVGGAGVGAGVGGDAGGGVGGGDPN